MSKHVDLPDLDQDCSLAASSGELKSTLFFFAASKGACVESGGMAMTGPEANAASTAFIFAAQR
jgi:hypothetical protein